MRVTHDIMEYVISEEKKQLKALPDEAPEGADPRFSITRVSIGKEQVERCGIMHIGTGEWNVVAHYQRKEVGAPWECVDRKLTWVEPVERERSP